MVKFTRFKDKLRYLFWFHFKVWCLPVGQTGPKLEKRHFAVNPGSWGGDSTVLKSHLRPVKRSLDTGPPTSGVQQRIKRAKVFTWDHRKGTLIGLWPSFEGRVNQSQSWLVVNLDRPRFGTCVPSIRFSLSWLILFCLFWWILSTTRCPLPVGMEIRAPQPRTGKGAGMLREWHLHPRLFAATAPSGQALLASPQLRKRRTYKFEQMLWMHIWTCCFHGTHLVLWDFEHHHILIVVAAGMQLLLRCYRHYFFAGGNVDIILKMWKVYIHTDYSITVPHSTFLKKNMK